MSVNPDSRDTRSGVTQALALWRTDRSFRWLIIGILLCLGLVLAIALQLR